MQEARGIEQKDNRLDWAMAGALTAAGALTRLPNLALIPVFSDEVRQAVEALNIRPGGFMPLVGYDGYSGPMFAYTLAVFMRVFGVTPVTPRILTMIMGALTVGATYWLARALGLSRGWAALVGLLMIANPFHILISSHYAGTTFVMPLFSTIFLAVLATAVKRESGPWLVAAGALLGLAMQTNPATALMLPGVVVWFLLQPAGGLRRRKSSIGLRTRWPYLAVIAAFVVYSPVIIYNVQTGIPHLMQETQHKVYVWQVNPTPSTFAQNLGLLSLQLLHQVSGVLEGVNSFQPLIARSVPLVLCVWGVAGLIYSVRRSLSLVTLAVSSHVLIMPWVSNYYGDPYTTRFTNQLTPLLFVGMGAVAAGAWSKAGFPAPFMGRSSVDRRFIASRVSFAAFVVGTLLVALALSPLNDLFRYYQAATVRGETNAQYYAWFDEFTRRWHGEKIFVTDSMGGGMTTRYFFAIYGVPYNLLPVGRIMETLTNGQETGSVIVILKNEELPRAQQQAELIPWHSPVLDASYAVGDYGIYTIPDAQKVRKPPYVFKDTRLAPAVHPVQVSFVEGLGLIGYEVKSGKVTPGSNLDVLVYWKALVAMNDLYTGYMHLIGPDGRLVAQDDHELGRGFYTTGSWQPDEVVREKYTLAVPKDAPAGEYTLRAGAYSLYPLKRLTVRSSSAPAQDDEITLGTVHVGP